MIRKDLETISDDEFDKIVEPVDNKIINKIKNEYLDEFIAYYLYEHYIADALWDEPLKVIAHGAIDGTLSQFRVEDCNLDKVKKILETKYKLKIVNDDDLIIEELQ